VYDIIELYQEAKTTMNVKFYLIFISCLFAGCNEITSIVPSDTVNGMYEPSKPGPYTFSTIGNDTTLPSYMSNVFDLTYRIPRSDTSLPIPTIIVEPGYFSWSTQLDDIQNRFASHGFLVVGVNNRSHFKVITTSIEPYKNALLETIHYLIESTGKPSHPLFGKVDTSAIAICGHSMGGGGVIMASNAISDPYNKYIKTAVAMNPFGRCTGKDIKIPMMLFSSDLDHVINPFMPEVNSTPSHIYYSFQTIKNSKAKLFANFKDMDHSGVVDNTIFIATSGNADIFLPSMVSWFKVYLADDSLYESYLDPNSSNYKSLSSRFVSQFDSIPAYTYVK
jgi:pimeloyl-ACP methyl ester carboxylesterase